MGSRLSAQGVVNEAGRFHNAGKTEKAVSLLKTSVNEHPGRIMHWRALANLYGDQGKLSKAADCFIKILKRTSYKNIQAAQDLFNIFWKMNFFNGTYASKQASIRAELFMVYNNNSANLDIMFIFARLCVLENAATRARSILEEICRRDTTRKDAQKLLGVMQLSPTSQNVYPMETNEKDGACEPVEPQPPAPKTNKMILEERGFLLPEGATSVKIGSRRTPRGEKRLVISYKNKAGRRVNICCNADPAP